MRRHGRASTSASPHSISLGGHCKAPHNSSLTLSPYSKSFTPRGSTGVATPATPQPEGYLQAPAERNLRLQPHPGAQPPRRQRTATSPQLPRGAPSGEGRGIQPTPDPAVKPRRDLCTAQNMHRPVESVLSEMPFPKRRSQPASLRSTLLTHPQQFAIAPQLSQRTPLLPLPRVLGPQTEACLHLLEAELLGARERHLGRFSFCADRLIQELRVRHDLVEYLPGNRSRVN